MQEDPRLQGASPTKCSADADCPAALVCYDSSNCDFVGNTSYCLCSTWYGWVLSPTDPPNCDLGTNTIISIAFFSVCGVIFGGILMIVSRDMYRMLSYTNWKRKQSLMYTMICLFGWALVLLLRMILVSIEFGSPQVQTYLPFGPLWKYSPYGIFATRPLTAASQIFSMLVDFNLIMVWFSIASKALRISRKLSHEFTLKVVVACIEISYIIGASILLAGSFSYFLLFSIPYLALVVIGYAIAGYMLTSLMKRLAKQQQSRNVDNAEIKRVTKRIQCTAIVTAICILMCIPYSYLYAYYNADFENEGFYVAGTHNAGVAIMTVQILVATNFLHLSVQSVPARRKTLNLIRSRQGNDNNNNPNGNARPGVRAPHAAVRDVAPNPANRNSSDHPPTGAAALLARSSAIPGKIGVKMFDAAGIHRDFFSRQGSTGVNGESATDKWSSAVYRINSPSELEQVIPTRDQDESDDDEAGSNAESSVAQTSSKGRVDYSEVVSELKQDETTDARQRAIVIV